MVKVSVVIPVYNVEDFLEECLDSIVNQTLDDIEIICVNDGSTDNSLNILNDYAKKDDRFTIVSQENGGHAVATNRGMELATGEYLFLMDSDDILKLNALEDTVRVAEAKNVDFVIFQAINYYMDTDEYKKRENYSMNRLNRFVGDRVFNWRDIEDYAFKITVTPWSKLYKREFVVNCGAKFPEGLIFDDNVFFWQVFFNAERITFHKDYLFIRRWYSESSTKAGDLRFLDSIKILDIMWDLFKEYGVFDTFKKNLFNQRVHVGYKRLSEIKEEYRDTFFKEFKKTMLDIKNDSSFDDFEDYLIERNEKIYSLVLKSDDPLDIILNIENYDLKNKIEKLREKNSKLKEKNKQLKKENRKLKKQNDEILKSNSWKITKPLRSIRK